MPKRLKLSNPHEIRQALTRIANMVLNGALDPKAANSITMTCNIILASIKSDGAIIPMENTGGNDMKTNKQYTVQYLLKMAEITADDAKRNGYLEQAEKLIFQGVSDNTVRLIAGKEGAAVNADTE